MSGRDERKVLELPVCPYCDAERDIVVEYLDGDVAGWVLTEAEVKRLNTQIVLNRLFVPERKPAMAYCLLCGKDYLDISNKAIKYFVHHTQAGNYLTWEEYEREHGI